MWGILLLFLWICSDFRNEAMILICICLHTLFQFPKSDSIFHLKHYPLPVALTLFPTPQDLFEQHALFNNTLCDCKKIYIYIYTLHRDSPISCFPHSDGRNLTRRVLPRILARGGGLASSAAQSLCRAITDELGFYTVLPWRCPSPSWIESGTMSCGQGGICAQGPPQRAGAETSCFYLTKLQIFFLRDSKN